MHGSVNQLKGYRRDKQIIELLEARRALDTEQIRVLLFPFRYGRAKAQQRLKKLYDRQRVNRWRPAPESPYIYFLGEKHGRIEHLVALNWVYCWMLKRLKTWESLYRWDYEQDYGILRCDAFAAVKNNVTGQVKFCFVELDRSKNIFDKVKKYCDLYVSGKYLGHWWVEMADRFPPVLIVTTSPGRAKIIRECISHENTAGLEFTVKLVKNVKEECCRENNRVLP